MRHAATTLITVAFLMLTGALPSRAAGLERGAREQPSALVQVFAGVLATTVQVSVYGGCRALGGEHLRCVESADTAGRRSVGRPLADG